jgi:hypothetical protein
MSDSSDAPIPPMLSYSEPQPKRDREDRGFHWFSYIAVGIAILSLLVALLLMVGCVWLLIRWLA